MWRCGMNMCTACQHLFHHSHHIKNTFWKHIILQLLCLIEIATHEKILATANHQGHEPKHDFGFLVAEVEIE